MVLDKPVDSLNAESSFSAGLAASQSQHQVVGDGSFRSGFQPWQKLKPSVEILCNDQASNMFCYKRSYDSVDSRLRINDSVDSRLRI